MRKVPLLELLLLRFPKKSARELSALILRGDVEVDGRTVLKPGSLAAEDSVVSLRAPRRFVSRGGEKLAHALESFELSASGRVFIDAGSSTGGFTDCLLKSGATRVYCVDVGYNVLDYGLRRDPRVVVMERTNVMSLGPDDFSPPPHMAVADLSFRSLRKAARHILDLTKEGAGIFLVKPQFEWEDPPREFHGVVEDDGRLREILVGVLEGLRGEGVHPAKGVRSPITGRKGNREFLFLLRAHPAPDNAATSTTGRGSGSSELETLVDRLLGE